MLTANDRLMALSIFYRNLKVILRGGFDRIISEKLSFLEVLKSTEMPQKINDAIFCWKFHFADAIATILICSMCLADHFHEIISTFKFGVFSDIWLRPHKHIQNSNLCLQPILLGWHLQIFFYCNLVTALKVGVSKLKESYLKTRNLSCDKAPLEQTMILRVF